MEGAILNARYRLDCCVGRGGFGEVFKGHDLHLSRTVAIKLLASNRSDARYEAMLRREAQDVARLRHPNIVSVFDFGEDKGRSYLVMEFIDGPTLFDQCKVLESDLPRVLSIADVVCSAMQYAHTAGIIHRDLTLKNVMIDGSATPLVLDFGLAKRIQTETESQSGSIVGTALYMAPEQASGREVDGRADIFSFGVCLYRIVAGRFPFEAEHPTAIIYLAGNEDPPPLPAHVPAGLQDVILKCLEKKPEHRFQSFGELKLALASLDRRSIASSKSAASSTSSAARPQDGRHNPYLNRVMIKDPDDFFGREREVKRIYSRLDAPHPQSVSILGERRMGKSSLLNYLYHRRNRRKHMENHGTSLFLYLDFQRMQNVDVEKFIDILFSMVAYELGEEISATASGRTLEVLDAAIARLNEKGMRVIMLLDEFDAITSNPRFEMQFFSFLRYLANNYKVAYVTSSHNDLQQMCHDKDIADSPFFNIFSTLQLRPFSHAEALSLVKMPSERAGRPLERHSDRILTLSGCFPLFIQIACAATFESISEQPSREPDWQEVERTFMEEAQPHFAFVWERMEPAARENLRRVATGRWVERRFAHVNNNLVQRGYLVELDGSLRLCSDPFHRFVMAQDAHASEASGQGRGWLRWFGRK